MSPEDLIISRGQMGDGSGEIQILKPKIQIPKSEIAVRNPSFDVVDYEEPSPVQPIIYDTKEPKRERRASVALESPYHVESDGYLLVTGEDLGVSSI